MERRPKGYVGERHETIGSDILAVLRALTFPLGVLGADTVDQLESVDPEGWYPIAWLLDLMDRVDRRVGSSGLVKIGRTLFKLSHEARVLQVVRSARDIVYGIDGMYRHANRGVGIGGWTVLSFEPGRATLEKTTPHHCAMEEGILSAGLEAMRAPSRIAQSSCFRKGADACVFEVTSAVTDERWSGESSAIPASSRTRR